VRWQSWQRERCAQVLTGMDAEIAWLAEQHERVHVERSGGHARDPVAKAATDYAAAVLGRARRVTVEGLWHQLANAYYQAGTGRHKDMWPYVRRYVAPRRSVRAVIEAYRARQRA
jgi:hypothetical protein